MNNAPIDRLLESMFSFQQRFPKYNLLQIGYKSYHSAFIEKKIEVMRRDPKYAKKGKAELTDLLIKQVLWSSFSNTNLKFLFF